MAFDLNYDDYVDNKINLTINMNNEDIYDLSFDRIHVNTFYDILLILKNDFKDNKKPSHLIFFLNIEDKYSKKDVSGFECFQKFMLESQNINLEVKLKENYDLIYNDSSIIAILERLSEYFELILKALCNWDASLKFTKIEKLLITVNELISLYKATYSYVNEERVIFLKEEYNFTSFIVKY